MSACFRHRKISFLVATLFVLTEASGWTKRHESQIAAIRARISPPPPPPLETWSVELVAKTAGDAGLDQSTFTEHDIDGKALHELSRTYRATNTVPSLIDAAAKAHGPKLRFLRLLRKWGDAAEAPMPIGPPPPMPPGATLPSK